MPRTYIYEISYIDKAKADVELWALFHGERKNAVLACQGLLVEIRQSYNKASVFLNGERVKMPDVVCPWCFGFRQVEKFQGHWLSCGDCGLKFKKSGKFHPGLKMLNMGILVVWDEVEV